MFCPVTSNCVVDANKSSESMKSSKKLTKMHFILRQFKFSKTMYFLNEISLTIRNIDSIFSPQIHIMSIHPNFYSPGIGCLKRLMGVQYDTQVDWNSKNRGDFLFILPQSICKLYV